VTSGYPAPACTEPHQGCGCAEDASQGAHAGPCEYEGGYGEGGAHVLCTLCLDAIAEHKRAACPDCGGTGRVATHVCRDERECARVCPQLQPCAACLGQGLRS